MSEQESPEVVTAGAVEQGSEAGGRDGSATLVELLGRASPRGGRPGAKAVLDVASAKIVTFEFETGDVLNDHAARHPVLIQVVRGRVELELPDRQVELTPGAVIHLTPMLRHAVKALEPSTLAVTMLLPHD